MPSNFADDQSAKKQDHKTRFFGLGKKVARFAYLPLMALITIILAWWSFLNYHFVPLAVLGAIPFIYLLVKSRKLAILCVVLSPYIVLPVSSTGQAVFDYENGSAILRCIGLPKSEAICVDRDLRLQRSFSAPIGYLQVLFADEIYNAALFYLIRTRGYMHGSYLGPYPSREKAYSLLRERGKQAMSYIDQHNVFHADAYEYKLSENEAKRLSWSLYATLGEASECSIYIIDSRCMLISTRDVEHKDTVLMLDLATGEVFAHYVCDDPSLSFEAVRQ